MILFLHFMMKFRKVAYFHVGMVHVQKKIAAAKSAIKANKTKEEGQQQQLSTATDELPEAEATVEELGTDLEEETKKLEDMQHDLQGEVSWPHQQC